VNLKGPPRHSYEINYMFVYVYDGVLRSTGELLAWLIDRVDIDGVQEGECGY